MRAIVALVLVTIAAPAHAESFVDIYGGISIPIADDDWTDAVESSPVIGARAGAFPKEIGGYLQVEWMPTNTDAQGWNVPGSSGNISAHRFRVMVGPLLHRNIGALSVTGRAGIGIDIAYARASGNIGPVSFDESETDVGLGFEFAGGLWFKLGNLEVGGELALPVGLHDDDNNAIDFNYTSVDIQLLFGVRFLSN
jgi:hypothetical protein